MERTVEYLTAAHEAHIKAWKARKKPTVAIPCPACNRIIEHKRPRKGDTSVWDSLATCPYCLALYFYSITAHDYKVRQSDLPENLLNLTENKETNNP